MCFLLSQNLLLDEVGAPQRMTTDNSNRIEDLENCSECHTDTLHTFNRSQVWDILGGSLTLSGLASFKKFISFTNWLLPKGPFSGLYNMKRWALIWDSCLGF